MNKIRRRLREGVVVTPEKFGVGSIEWKGGVDFKVLDNLPESVKWWFSCLGFLRLLFTHVPIQDCDELICKHIILDFFNFNHQSSTEFSRAWDGHAVALRAGVLIDLYNISRDGDYLEPLLKKHLDFLYLEENFQGHWNHGIDQSIALIKLSRCLGETFPLNVGISRLCESLSVLVDEEGASIEQAVHYQLYNYKQLSRSVNLIKNICENEKYLAMVDALLEKQKLMGEFLAHATKPDGYYFELGDTPFQKAEVIGHENSDFAASLGDIGIAPKEKFKVYKAGYIFGRSNWQVGASAYSIRFGSPRMIHGHNDHSSIIYFSGGREVLRDGGFHGYTDDDKRKFLRSLEAHNVVYVENPKLRFKSCYSRLTSSHINDKFQKYTIFSNPYEGVESKRTLIFSQKPELIVVIDSLDSEDEVRAVQRWNFGKGIFLEHIDREVVSKNGGFKINQYYPFDEMKVYNEGDAGNPSLVASEIMYRLEDCSSIMTVRSGRKVTFLTVFCFSSDGDFPSVQHEKSKNQGARRELKVRMKEDEIRMFFLDDGNIDIF